MRNELHGLQRTLLLADEFNRLLEWNASSAKAEGFHVTPEGDHIISETQHVDYIIEAAKQASEMTPPKNSGMWPIFQKQFGIRPIERMGA